jgi:hypothetical protein
MKYDNLSLRKTNRSKIMTYQNTAKQTGIKTSHRTKILICSLLIVTCSLFFICCEQDPEPEEEKKTETTFTPPPAPPLPTGAHITISSEADLAKIGKDGAYPLNRYYELTENITVTDWSPIGSGTPFSGALDGRNHTITVTGTGGIFSNTKNANIWNLKVAGTITATSEAGTAVTVGGITGNADWTHITNCQSTASITATGHGHNSSAGGIAGNMRNNSMVYASAASGNVTLTSGETTGLMIYAGGLVGYSGTGLVGTGASGCLVTQSRWSGGTVSTEGGYPYSGGIVGYNYTGARISECYSAGTVSAKGGNLPYAGGVAGYNSGFVQNTAVVSVIENCYSTAAVTAESESRAALAGGIAGANAKGALISKCYATGTVTAKVTGTSGAGNGGTLGPKAAASGGGIAGAQYYAEQNIFPVIEKCAALNTALTGTDAATGAVWNIYRIAGAGDGEFNVGVWQNNIANSAMTITLANSGTHTDDKGASGKDGADAAAKPEPTVYTGMGWQTSVWKLESGQYPILRWQVP